LEGEHMVRVSNNLQIAAALLLCAAAAGCSSSDDSKSAGLLLPRLISFSPMYSAFDDNAHEYALTPSVPSAAATSKDADPVVAASIKWDVDAAFVKRDEFPELANSVKLTTKKTGETTVKVTAKTLSGQSVRGEAKLTISKASQSEWDAGEARYNNGMMITWMRPTMAASGEGTCGLPVTIDLPKTSACGNCHNSMANAISVEHTPTQTGGYSNEDLVNIFTTGAKPAGGTFNSPFLKNAPMPDCIYAAFHTWEMTDDEKKGIVWKLRSIAPRVQEEIDFGRLMMAARAMMQASGDMAAAPATP
jgi:uncharacterized low-complexity protein